MKPAIIISKKFEDNFGLKYGSLLKKNKIPFFETDKFPQFLTDKDLKHLDADCFIVLGIHSLSDKPKRLCVHPCGNWNKRWQLYSKMHLGGDEKALSTSSAALLKNIYLSLLKHNNLSDYKVDIECTHHGPNLSRPIVFLEIGSSPRQWQEIKAKKVIIKVLKNIKPKNKGRTAIVLGGKHYMKNISYLLRNTDIQVSHMCSSSHLHSFDGSSLKEVIKKTHEKVDFAIIDIAGVGQHKDRIFRILEKNDLPYIYLHKIKPSFFKKLKAKLL